MFRIGQLWRAMGFALLCAAHVTAPVRAQPNADAAFDAGIRASRAGNHGEALRHFQRAQVAGLDRPALHYNLGVTHYRLGNYLAARESFQRITGDSALGALAHYNLGLVALRLNDEAEARRQFRLAQQLTHDEKLRYLARQQLAQLAADEPRRSATVSAGAGYDDNLIVQDTGGVARGGDRFFELFAAGSITVHGTPRDGVRLDGSAYLVEYLDEDAFSMTILRGGGARAMPLGEWHAEAGGDLELSTLGSRDYLRTLSAHVAGKRRIEPDTTLDLRYRFSDIHARDPLFSQLNGYQHRVTVNAMRSRNDEWFGGRAFLEYNDRADLREGGIFTSFSPMRLGLRAEYGREIARDWEASASAGLMSSRYRTADELASGDRVRRKDDQLQFGARVGRNFGERWQIAGEYQFYDNDSNIPAYDYRRNVYMLRASGVF